MQILLMIVFSTAKYTRSDIYLSETYFLAETKGHVIRKITITSAILKMD